MRALCVTKGRLAFVADYPRPERRAGEALIRVTLAGVCSTDLEILRGYVPNFAGVLGHEFVGVVAEADDDRWVGKRVTGSINLGCGACAECIGRGAEHCPTRTVLGIINKDGAFAEYVTLPEVNLYEVPEGVSDETAVFTEPLAAALRIREQVRVRPMARVGVIGPGRLGMLIAAVLAEAGTAVVLLGRRAESLALGCSWGLETRLIDEVDAYSFDMVVEATGNAAGLALALRLTKPQGDLILKSTYAAAPAVDLTPLVVNELRVTGSRCGPFAPALRLLAQGRVPVLDMVERVYPLAEGTAALARAAEPGVRKVLLKMADGNWPLAASG